ncbi:cache domain-containing sensor histidine kinase [Cohnella zeiphila]|uniref:histidine kinase n=1 Tax=Cohnella zeiphila TaxID=2761120 RepID=A0A7X0SNG3_9BACL|nr:sensor histidine kinase [Cohnella zeiphila]MBB6733247.1 sensor histidine kinase [Cohnella zeiphila]
MLRSFFFARQSIRAKIFLAFSCVTALSLMAVSAVLYIHMSGEATRNATRFASDNLRHSNEVMQMILEDVDRINTVVVADSGSVDVIAALRSDAFDPSYEWFREKQGVTALLTNLIAYKTPITSIAVVGLNGKMYTSGTPEWVEKQRLTDDAIRQVSEGAGKHVYILRRGADGEPEALMVGRPIHYNNRPIGAVITELDYRQIERIYQAGLTPGVANDVVAQDGRIIVSGNPQLPADAALHTLAAEPPAVPKASSRIVINGERYITVSSAMPYAGWTAQSAIPVRTLLPRYQQLRLQMAETAAAVFLAVLIVSMGVAAGITRNLRRLYQDIQHVKQGRMTVRASIRTKDEVGHLYRAFSGMVEQLKVLMNDIKRGERQKREAELQALQAQVGPHFLYNTLNSIKYLARLRHASNIEETVASLIDLLRAVLGNTKEFVTLREELDYVQAYLNIQKLRFNNRIEARIRIDPELYGCVLPKMIVQPIVENAMIHGLAPLRQGGTLAIEGFRDGGFLVVSVTDDGVGMSGDQIERLLRKGGTEGSGRSSFSGIGIANVRERIRMTCGPESQLQISSVQGEFTTVKLRLPLAEGEGACDAARAVGG